MPLIAPDSLVDKARQVVNQLRMPKGYQPERYPNPALQWHYKILQAIALEEDLPAEPEDYTLPKYKSIYNRTRDAVLDWQDTLEQVYKDDEAYRPTTNTRSGVLGKRRNEDRE